ncbi:MAG: translation initiation factor IF-3 [Alphaproteobacteria bacterium]|nr:translation initiation factor IF-3 [Alphaproteobacteria bacterium]
MAKPVQPKKSSVAKQELINDDIIAEEVRLIGKDGEQLGIVPLQTAKSIAYNDGLDLYLVSNDAKPPVCKVLDYGKYKYELQKKKAESKKKQKVIEIKEVQVRPFIGENDLLIKCKAIRKFIENGNKVKLSLRFRGREMTRQDLGKEVIQKILDFCQEFAKEESPAKLEGNTILAILTAK